MLKRLSMKDIKKLKDEVKFQLDNKVVAEILSFIGYEISRDYKFVNDKSFSISKDGLIKDFGATGFTGDIFAFIMEEKSISFVESVKYVADCLGVNYE
jgi:DNA primase